MTGPPVGFGRLSGLIRNLPFGSLLAVGGLAAPFTDEGFDTCAGGLGLPVDLAEGAGNAFVAPPADGNAFGLTPADGKDFGAAEAFDTESEAFTGTFFCAALTGPSAEVMFFTPSP